MENSKEDLALGEAAQWRARLSASDCSAEERAAFARWRETSMANAAAFHRINRASVQIEQALVSDERWRMLAERALQVHATPADKAATRSGFRYRMPMAMAASAILATLSAWIAMSWYGANDHAAVAAQIVSAPERSARQVELSDGSIAYVDAGANISVAIGERERRVEVLSGKALFEVAHDKQRPFIVSSGGTHTVALGTQFQVQRNDAQTVVTLVEGSVEVSGQSNGWRERLIPGEQLRVPVGRPGEHVRYGVDAATVTSWSRGWLVFRGIPLGEALQEINRYSGKQVRLADASLATLEVAGSFIAGDSVSIVNAIAEVLPIRAVDGGSTEIILFKRYDN